MRKILSRPSPTLNTERPKLWSPFLQFLKVTIPYIKGTSETISRILQPYNIRVAHKTYNLVTTITDQRERQRRKCKFDLDQSELKSSQVNASARKAWPNEVASRPKFSTCVYLRLRLARALEYVYLPDG